MSLFGELMINGFAFKMQVASLDTPLFDLITHVLPKHFYLQMGEELELIVGLQFLVANQRHYSRI